MGEVGSFLESPGEVMKKEVQGWVALGIWAVGMISFFLVDFFL